MSYTLGVDIGTFGSRGVLVDADGTVIAMATELAKLEAGELKFELLDIVAGAGLALLPEPSPGDIFFDIEGDSFIGEHGLEYMFGYHYADSKGDHIRVVDWAFDRVSEKAIFERFMDFALALIYRGGVKLTL